MLVCKNPKIFDVDFYWTAAGLALVGFAWLLLLKPLENKIIQQRQTFQQQQQNADKAQSELDRLQKLAQQEQALANWLKQSKNVLDGYAGLAEVLRNMEQLCRKCQLQLEEITPLESDTAAHFNKNGVHLRLSGSFQQGRLLLQRMEEQLPYVRVRTMSVAAKQTRPALGEIIMDVDVFGPGR